jgi:hypothetical protein
MGDESGGEDETEKTMSKYTRWIKRLPSGGCMSHVIEKPIDFDLWPECVRWRIATLAPLKGAKEPYIEGVGKIWSRNDLVPFVWYVLEMSEEEGLELYRWEEAQNEDLSEVR